MGFDFQMQNKSLDLPPDYKPLYEEMPGAYQLSSTGVAVVGEMMFLSGVLDTITPFPDFNPPILNRLFAKVSELLRLAPAWSIDNLIERESPFEGKVPAYKFSSNDGWLVSERECTLICNALAENTDNNYSKLKKGKLCQKISDQEFLTLFNEWLSYNSVAARNGGYRVL